MKLLEHNQIAVNKICAAFENNNNIIYVSGVGTGKTYVFMGVALRLCCKKILYVIPKHSISENIIGYKEYRDLDIQVDFVTYNYFNDAYKGLKKCLRYDLVVIDEAHHIGSDVYGKKLLDIMGACDVKFLGLTATPKRDCDAKNVCEYFDEVVLGLSHFEAIRSGLMPMFNYRICLPDQDLRQLEQKYNYKVKAKIDYSSCAAVLYDIATKFKRNKWICFFSTTEAIKENYDMIETVFDGYEIFILHSKLNNLKEVVDGVKKAEKAIILSVNMLLEGVHFENIGGIALFRNVTSLSTFQQILGRVCSIEKKESPIVVDCSSSGKELLAKLEYENTKGLNNTTAAPGAIKPIMTVGLGSHEEWDGIEQLMESIGTYKSREKIEQERVEKLEKALKEYQKFNGLMSFNSLEEIKRNKSEYAKLKACAEINYITGQQLAMYIICIKEKG